MPIQQCLQDRNHIGLGHSDRGLHHSSLVELIHRARHVLQPPDDRGRREWTDTVVDHLIGTGRDTRHPGQPGHGLLDENVAWPQRHTGRAGPSHHLHRQNAVPAQFEERLIDPDPLQTQHLGIDAGQNLLDRVARSPVGGGILILRHRKGPLVEFAVDGQRHRVDHHDRGRNHVLG